MFTIILTKSCPEQKQEVAGADQHQLSFCTSLLNTLVKNRWTPEASSQTQSLGFTLPSWTSSCELLWSWWSLHFFCFVQNTPQTLHQVQRGTWWWCGPPGGEKRRVQAATSTWILRCNIRKRLQPVLRVVTPGRRRAESKDLCRRERMSQRH